MKVTIGREEKKQLWVLFSILLWKTVTLAEDGYGDEELGGGVVC